VIAFKRFDTLDEWVAIHPTLKALLAWIEARWNPTVTRIYDPPVTDESGVHRQTPHRAADLRTNDVPKPEGERLVRLINDDWDYGDGKHVVAIQHGAGDDRHIHLQVRDETRLRNA